MELEPGDNFEQYITFRSHPSLGLYRVTYFDWLYYYEKYKPWISQRSYQECIKHYLTYGFQTHLTTFEKGCNLLQKYKIKVIASFITSSHEKDSIPNSASLQRQAELARQHSISGWAIHYYWIHGKPMNHQIAELLINNPTIGMDFYLIWSDGTMKNDTDEWFQHFQFLLPFFQSPHYLKIKDKNKDYPIMMIQQSAQYPPAMYQLWTQLAQQNGFGGLYFTAVLTSKSEGSGCSHQMQLNPWYTMDCLGHRQPWCRIQTKGEQMITSWDYPVLCHHIVNSPLDKSNQASGTHTTSTFYSMFTGIDNTRFLEISLNETDGGTSYSLEERRSVGFLDPDSKDKCYVRTHRSTPQAVGTFLQALIESSISLTEPDGTEDAVFIVVESWNDWANQMVLYQSQKGHYPYLEAIHQVMTRYQQPHSYNKWRNVVLRPFPSLSQ